MDGTIIAGLIALAFGAGFGLAHLWNRSRPAHDVKRAAELEAQLNVARDEANRRGVQLAELERETSTLRMQLLEAVQSGAAFEERSSQLEQKLRERGEVQRALENTFKALSADALKSNNQSFLDLARTAGAVTGAPLRNMDAAIVFTAAPAAIPPTAPPPGGWDRTALRSPRPPRASAATARPPRGRGPSPWH